MTAPALPRPTTCHATRLGQGLGWLGLLAAVALALACNRRPREVDLDVTLVNDVHAPRPSITTEPIDVYVPAGTLVRLLLHNHTSSVHNFVLVQPGHIDEVLAAAAAPPGDRSAEAAQAAVLARSPWVAPGQRQVVAFVAPPAGYYEFTCSCSTASHPSPLRGKLVVQ